MKNLFLAMIAFVSFAACSPDIKGNDLRAWYGDDFGRSEDTKTMLACRAISPGEGSEHYYFYVGVSTSSEEKISENESVFSARLNITKVNITENSVAKVQISSVDGDLKVEKSQVRFDADKVAHDATTYEVLYKDKVVFSILEMEGGKYPQVSTKELPGLPENYMFSCQ